MKVWLLRNSFDSSIIGGVFTSAGKKAQEKALLTEALARRDTHIESLRKDIKIFQEEKEKYIATAVSLLAADNTADDTYAQRAIEIDYSYAAEQVRLKQRDIDLAYNRLYDIARMDNSELLRDYCPKWYWEAYELEGD